MADQILPSSKAPQSTGNIPELKKQERLQPETGTPGFGQALTNLAFTPSALGDLGATMAQSASIAISKSRGEALGQNPEGELLPPITDADKTFNEAYSAQASATLSMQAQNMMEQGQEELNKSYALSPGLINSFKKNMSEGMQDILDHAPSTIRGSLSNNFTQEIMTSSHRANMTMVSQQKERAKSQATAFSDHLIDQMHDASLAGNPDLAKEIYGTLNEATEANLNSGMWSPEQAETLKHQAKISYYSSGETAQAMAARQDHKLEGYLSNMVNTKPKDVSWSEWEKVRNQVVGYIGAVENLDNRDQSLIISQANAQATRAPLEPAYIEKMRSKLQPARFNNFMSGYASKLKGQYAQQQRVAGLQASWSNPLTMNSATKDDLNKAFVGQVEAAKVNARQQGVELSDDDAQLETASTAGAPIPAYIDKLNVGLQSGNPDLMMRGWQDYTALVSSGGQASQGIKKQSIAMGTMMNHFLEQGMPPDIAAQRANETIMDKTEEARKNTEQLVSDWKKTSVKDATHRDTWARNLAGVSRGTFMSNSAGFSLHVQNIMEDNLALTNGNVAASESMLQDAIKQYWGFTEVNGQKEFTYMPIEKVLQLDKGATPLIKSDMLHQLGRQLEPTKAAYDNGSLSYYYRIKDHVGFDEYLESKKKVESKQTLKAYGKALFSGKSDVPALKKDFETISKYEANTPSEIEMVHRNGDVESFQLNTNPSPMIQQSTGETPIIGDYDFSMSNDKGGNFPLTGAFHGQQSHPVYRPDSKWIKDNYFKLNGIDPSDEHAKEVAMAEYNEKRARELDPRYQRLRLGAL